jgi:uncharacterized membrane protein
MANDSGTLNYLRDKLDLLIDLVNRRGSETEQRLVYMERRLEQTRMDLIYRGDDIDQRLKRIEQSLERIEQRLERVGRQLGLVDLPHPVPPPPHD